MCLVGRILDERGAYVEVIDDVEKHVVERRALIARQQYPADCQVERWSLVVFDERICRLLNAIVVLSESFEIRYANRENPDTLNDAPRAA